MEDQQPYEKYLHKLVKVNTDNGNVAGTLIEISEPWLTLEKKYGKTIDVRLKSINIIGEIDPKGDPKEDPRKPYGRWGD